jgi:hypothetical protein
MKKKNNAKEITLDLPEVKDIPGQEHIRPPRINEMIDSTASSAGEEGEGILDGLNEDTIADDETNVTASEKKLLKATERPPSPERRDIEALSLDKTDGEDLLNEESDPQDLGEGLDVPGAELDDDDEEIGEEDEENNSYSTKDE